MAKLLLERFELQKEACIGKLKVLVNDDEIYSCFTLEEELEGVARNQDLRIPPGIYHLQWHHSNKFGRCVLIHNEDVPKDRYILIHAGNTDKDTLGCVLVGKTYGNNFVGRSKVALNELYMHLNRLPIDKTELEIINAF